MIVFDLKCQTGHVFEAWFGSSTDYESQKERGLLSCPLCGNSDIIKAPMAANVPAKGKTADTPVTAPVMTSAEPTAAEVKQFLATMAKAQKDALKSSTWVGRDFDSQARAMDAGEITHASIYGEVSPAEAKSLVDDGISVMPLPFPVIPPDKSN